MPKVPTSCFECDERERRVEAVETVIGHHSESIADLQARVVALTRRLQKLEEWREHLQDAHEEDLHP